MPDDAVALWISRRQGSRKKDKVLELMEKKHSTDERLARTGF